MRFAKRVDQNHAAIREAARQAGWRVEDTSDIGHGFPDQIWEKPDRIVWVEVKDGSKPPSARKLTPKEAALHELLKRSGIDVKVIERVEQIAEL